MRVILLLCLSILGVANGCQMAISKSTWDFNPNRDAMIPGIYTFEECEAECWSKAQTCIGFTHQNQGVLKVCFLFKELNNLQECSDCNSGTIATPIEGGCAGGDTLDQVDGYSLFDCITLCKNTQDCVASTWFNGSFFFPNQCFLFDSCFSTSPCEYCETGVLSCIDLPTQCKDYKILDSRRRNVNSEWEDGDFHGDKLSCVGTNSDWQGSSFYRFQSPAGIKIPEYYPQWGMCSTYNPGWVNGTHPTKIGIEKNVEIVFGTSYGGASNPPSIGITNCGDFYAYNLPDTLSCSRAYCGTFN